MIFALEQRSAKLTEVQKYIQERSWFKETYVQPLQLEGSDTIGKIMQACEKENSSERDVRQDLAPTEVKHLKKCASIYRREFG